MVGRRGSLGLTSLAFLSTLVIMFVVPLPVYALMSAIGLVEMPDEGTPGRSLVGANWASFDVVPVDFSILQS